MGSTFKKNLIEAFKLPPPMWTNQPQAIPLRSSSANTSEGTINVNADGRQQSPIMSSELRSSLMAMTKNLYYIGVVKKIEEARDVSFVNALISGFIQRAKPEPYRFSKGVSDFTIKFVGNSPPPNVAKSVDDNPNLIIVRLSSKASISLYSLSGNGLDVFGENSLIKICGHLLLVDERDGSLINRLSQRHTIKLSVGHVKFYVFDDDIMILDNPMIKYQIDQ